MVKQPDAMSNQRASGLGSVIVEVVAAILVFGTLDFDFLTAALVIFLTAALVLGVFFAAVFLVVDLGAVDVAVVTASFGAGSSNTFMAPGVGSMVHIHRPLISAQA